MIEALREVGLCWLLTTNSLICEQLTVPDDIEGSCSHYQLYSKKIIFGIVYIPPNLPDAYHSSVFNFIHSLPLTNNTIIVGDFNYPDIVGLPFQVLRNLKSSSFCDLIFDINFVQIS